MTATRLLLEGLKAHYRKPGTDQDGEVLLTEVTAPGSNRSCDLLRIGTWASRGLGIDVHELKTSRSDWLRELDDPGKADAWWPYCSRFWVAAPRGVVNPDELPTGWGLLTPPSNSNHRRFKAVVKAEAKTPKLTLSLLVAIVKRTDNTRISEMERLRHAHQEEVVRRIRQERQQSDRTILSPDTRRRLEMLDKLEAVVGAKLTDYGWGPDLPLKDIEPHELAAAVQEYTQEHVALQRRQKALNEDMRRFRESLERSLSSLRRSA
jgi:hypothetical protein